MNVFLNIFFPFRDDSKENTNDDSFLRDDNMPDLEVEFTPLLTWKCKAKSK